MSGQKNYLWLKKRLPLILTTKAGVKDICSYLFQNDTGHPLVVTNYQAKIIQKIFFKYPSKIVCTATTRAGKSLGMALGIILLSVFRNGRKVRLIAPTVDHTKIVMGYVIQHILDHPICSNQLMINTKGMGVERLKKELTKHKMTLKNGSEIMSITANISGEGRSLVGWGGTDIFVDEAEQINAEIMRTKVMRMLGDAPDASIFMIGNPVTHGYMYEKSTDPNWDFMHIDWRMCVSEGRLTKEFVEERKEEMISNEFDIWYEALWPDELENQLFTKLDMANFTAPLTEKEIALLKTEPDEKRLGCDIARFGVDLTVLYRLVRYGDTWFFTNSIFFEKQDTMKTTGAIVNWDKDENFDLINVDDSGLGGGVTDRLHEIDQTRGKTIGFVAGESAWNQKEVSRKLNVKELDDNKRFLNKKALYYKNLESMCRKGKARLVDEKNRHKLIKELKGILYEHQSNGKMKITDPTKSPDFADAAMIGIYSKPKIIITSI